MAVAQNNQFTAIDFRYIKDDALLGCHTTLMDVP